MKEIVFNSMDELATAADQLDRCVRIESSFKHPATGLQTNDPRRRDIVNLHTGTRSAVVSSIYHEYQHYDVVSKVAETLNHAKVEAHGSIYDAGDRMALAIFFDNIEALKDPTSDKGIKIGALFRNSYNRQNSVTGAGYFMRLECLNQMYFGSMVKELKFSERHTGSIVHELPSSIQDFTDNLLMMSKFIGKAIENSATIQVKFETRDQKLLTMQSLVDHVKWGEKVSERLDTLTPTKWDIYNALTEVTSHESMGETARAKLEKLSEKVLAPTYKVIPSVLVQTPARQVA
jgi:hypothetical protein